MGQIMTKGPYRIRRKLVVAGKWHYKLVDVRNKPERIIIEADHKTFIPPRYMLTLQAKYNSSTILNQMGVS